MTHLGPRALGFAACLAAGGLLVGSRAVVVEGASGAVDERVLLVGLGDSLSHGTMDATNNFTNTQNAYLQKIADKLAEVVRLRFGQPLYGFDEERLKPFSLPTNLGVDR